MVLQRCLQPMVDGPMIPQELHKGVGGDHFLTIHKDLKYLDAKY
jgi:hypothetical protein